MLDFLIRTGPYGDGFGSDPDGLTLEVLERNPHGIDLGPLSPRIPEALRTPSGKVELAPEAIVGDVDPDGDQILIVTEGTGVVATDTEERTVSAGDVILIPAGENHWHGAPGDTPMAHITVQTKDSKTTQHEQ